TVIDPEGKPHYLSGNDLSMSYRHSTLPEGWIVTSAILKGNPGQSPAEIGCTIDGILTEREASQPIKGRTGGSTFKNPDSTKAWELIDAAGCRGLTKGDAQVSEKHCNFLLNIDRATAYDLESLGEEVKRRVFEVSGILLD